MSRVVARWKTLWASWQARDRSQERYVVLFFDGFHLRGRLARRVIVVPLLAALGVTDTGQKQLVALQLVTAEATRLWTGLLADLQARGLPAPRLVVTDGHAGLTKALDAWPTVYVQRCTTHTWRNLEDARPVHARPALKRDYDRIIYAASGLEARAAYDAGLKQCTALCPAVARSLDEAGLALLTFYTFPKTMWKSLRTTNALENLNRGFRRRWTCLSHGKNVVVWNAEAGLLVGDKEHSNAPILRTAIRLVQRRESISSARGQRLHGIRSTRHQRSAGCPRP